MADINYDAANNQMELVFRDTQTNHALFKTYQTGDNGTVRCLLDRTVGPSDPNYAKASNSCVQVYDVYVASSEGILGQIATFTVTFQDECVHLATDYDASSHATQLTYWEGCWDPTSFNLGY